MPKARMTASQVYESELWDVEAARTMRPLSADERPVWMRENGDYDLFKLQTHLQNKYWAREDFKQFTRGDTALKCGDEVQVRGEWRLCSIIGFCKALKPT